MAKIKTTTTSQTLSFADAVAIRQKADKLLADAEKTMAEFQNALWAVMASKGQVSEGTYRDAKTNEILGTGPMASGNGVYQGKEFSYFSRWNRSEGKPTLVVKGLFGNGTTEKTFTEF